MDRRRVSRAKRFYFSWGQLCLYAAIPPLYFLWRPAHDVLAAVVIVSFVLHARGMFSPESRLLGEVFSRGDGSARAVALTFDDGPDPATTPAVLDLLGREGARATFFVVGEKALAHPAIVKRMAAEGHEVENHTRRHRWLFASYLLPMRIVQDEVEAAAGAIERLTGKRPRFLRPPIGFKNVIVLSLAERLGMVVTTFSMRSGDTCGRAAAARIAGRVTARAAPGEIVVFHDGTNEPLRRETLLAALGEVVPGLKARGFGFATVEELYGGAVLASPLGVLSGSVQATGGAR